MSSSEPSDREPAPSATARDTRIEQLLLGGLDHYFSGEFERSIQVWSRVFFLDRGHARAQAYIERARGALAERQREAEARVYRQESSRSPLSEPGHPFRVHLEGARETMVARRDFPGLGLGPAAARAVLPEVEVYPEPVLRARAVAPAPRARLFTHVILVVLAAALLFTAGYVVAARDQLAVWWTVSSAPEPQLPGSAPSASPGTGSSARPRGSASR